MKRNNTPGYISMIKMVRFKHYSSLSHSHFLSLSLSLSEHPSLSMYIYTSFGNYSLTHSQSTHNHNPYTHSFTLTHSFNTRNITKVGHFSSEFHLSLSCWYFQQLERRMWEKDVLLRKRKKLFIIKLLHKCYLSWKKKKREEKTPGYKKMVQLPFLLTSFFILSLPSFILFIIKKWRKSNHGWYVHTFHTTHTHSHTNILTGWWNTLSLIQIKMKEKGRQRMREWIENVNKNVRGRRKERNKREKEGERESKKETVRVIEVIEVLAFFSEREQFHHLHTTCLERNEMKSCLSLTFSLLFPALLKSLSLHESLHSLLLSPTFFLSHCSFFLSVFIIILVSVSESNVYYRIVE